MNLKINILIIFSFILIFLLGNAKGKDISENKINFENHIQKFDLLKPDIDFLPNTRNEIYLSRLPYDQNPILRNPKKRFSFSFSILNGFGKTRKKDKNESYFLYDDSRNTVENNYNFFLGIPLFEQELLLGYSYKEYNSLMDIISRQNGISSQNNNINLFRKEKQPFITLNILILENLLINMSYFRYESNYLQDVILEMSLNNVNLYSNIKLESEIHGEETVINLIHNINNKFFMNYSIQPSSSIEVIKDEMTAPNYYSKKESGKIILGYKDTSNLLKIGLSITRYGEGLFKEWNRKDSKMIGYEKLYKDYYSLGISLIQDKENFLSKNNEIHKYYVNNNFRFFDNLNFGISLSRFIYLGNTFHDAFFSTNLKESDFLFLLINFDY